MKNRSFILLGAVILVVLLLMAVWFWTQAPRPSVQASGHQAQTPAAPSGPSAPPTPVVPSPSDLYSGPPLSIKKMSREEATRIYVERFNADHQYDWKVPINFYGKVVDENNYPVAGAHVHFDWNTTWKPLSGGTAYAQTISDGAGLFSLTGEHGKVLGVLVQKEGYFSVDRGGSSVPFEFANPSTPWWYEPDSNNPVIFHLRKKGEGAKLFSKSFDMHSGDRVNLMQGFIKPDGVLTVTTDFSKFLPGNQPFPWTASISMTEGGLAETSDQFPFMAPTSGYTPTVNLGMTVADTTAWQDGAKKTYYFYLPSSNTYGRISITLSSGLPIQISYVYDLTPGNRVLEPHDLH